MLELIENIFLSKIENESLVTSNVEGDSKMSHLLRRTWKVTHLCEEVVLCFVLNVEKV